MKKGREHGHRSQDQRTQNTQRTYSGGAGGQERAFQGVHIPAGKLSSRLPSISTLEDILQCLGVTINEFFTQEDAPAQVVFGEEDYFEKIDEELGNKTEWIIPNAQKNMMEPIRMTLEAGGSTYPDNPHEGEELGYVLRGEITIIIGKEKHRAKAGEAFYYTPDKKHYITSKKGAEILWVSAPPSF